MECNKDEAIKAKEMAEKMLVEQDIVGAKRLASKAQSLFPGLDGLSQFQQTLSIYAAAERKVNEEVDCYKILGVHPLADHETIKKQYKKLALALHPDKNNAVGADGAFKILSEAWSLLSDKVKRAAYDEKQNIRALYQKGAGQNPPGGVKEHGNENFTNTSSTVSKPSVPTNAQTDSAPPEISIRTFRTQCTRCLVKYRCLDGYQNWRLFCYTCYQPFMATEIPSPPVNNSPTSTPWSQYPQEQGGHSGNNASSDSGRNFPPIPKAEPLLFPGVGLNNRANVPEGSSFKFGGSRSMSTPATAAAQPANVPQGSSFKFGGSRSMSTPATAAAQPANVLQGSSFKFGGSRSMSTPVTAAAQPANVPQASFFQFGGSRSVSIPATTAAQPANVPEGSSFKFGGSRSMSTPATAAAQPTFTFQHMGEILKRGHEEAVTGKVHEEFLKSNISRKSDSGSPSYNVSSSGKATYFQCGSRSVSIPATTADQPANVPEGSSFKFGDSRSMSTPATAAAHPVNVPQDSSFKFGGSRSMSMPATAAAQPTFTFERMGDILKRGCEEAVTGKVHEELLKSNISKKSDSGSPSYNVSSSGKATSFQFGGSRSVSIPATTAPQPANVPEGSSFKFSGSRSMSTPATTAAHPVNVLQDSSFNFGGSRSMSMPATAAAQPTFTFQRTGENLKRGREEAVTGKVHEESLKSNISKKPDSGSPSYNVSSSGKADKTAKKRRIDEHKARVAGKDVKNWGHGNQMGKSEAEKVNTSDQPKSLRELSQSEVREMLMVKARTEIQKKLQQWNVAGVQKSSDKEVGQKPTGSKESSAASLKTFSNTTAIMSATEPDALGRLDSGSITGSSTEAAAVVTMDVLDPEFYDFDKDRAEESFAKDQVWAAYDNEDGMPRFYCIIHEVLSANPFKVQISWLNSKTSSEFGPINWIGHGFAKTCGVFRIGKHEVNKAVNSFSHRVSSNRGAKGVIQIFPKKGDVWALYRNWSSDWDELTPNDVIRQYDMVEVLDDYNEKQGVVVAPLVKTAGFRSVFHQHLDKNKIYTIPREEMFRFSHQVASYLLTGQETQAAPKDCRELDTAAVPLELLQVLKEAKEGKVGKVAEVSATGNVDATPSSKDVKRVVPEPKFVYKRRPRESRL